MSPQDAYERDLREAQERDEDRAEEAYERDRREAETR